MNRSWAIIQCCMIVSFSPAAAFADEARQVFDSLYGPKIKQAAATSDRTDDIALAKEMLSIAKESSATPTLQALLYDVAGDLASKHPDGFPTAIEAMQLLADSQEDQRESARDKLIELLTKQSRTGKAEERAQASDSLIELLITMGDEKTEMKQYADAVGDYRRANILAAQRKSDLLEAVKAKMEFAMGRDRAVKQIARLEEKLLKDSNDHASAEELVTVYLVELDDPAQALKYLDRCMDRRLKELTPLAASQQRVAPSKLLALGEWYCDLASSASAPFKEAMWRRALFCLNSFLEEPTADELGRAKAAVLQKRCYAAVEISEKGGFSRNHTVTRFAEIKRLRGHEGDVRSVHVVSDGKTVVSGSTDKTIRIWNVSTGKETSTLANIGGEVYDVQLSDNRKVAVANVNRSVLQTFDADSGKVIASRTFQHEGFGRIHISADGRIVVSGGLYRMHLTDGRTGAPIQELQVSAYATAITRDGRRTAYAGAEKTVHVFDVSPWKPVATLTGHVHHIYAICFSESGQVVASAGGGAIIVHDIGASKPVTQINIEKAVIHEVTLSKDGKRIMAWSDDGVTRVFSVPSGKELYKVTETGRRGDLSSDGKTAFIPVGRDVAIWNLP